jgi:hypothetical protein
MMMEVLHVEIFWRQSYMVSCARQETGRKAWLAFSVHEGLEIGKVAPAMASMTVLRDYD